MIMITCEILLFIYEYPTLRSSYYPLGGCRCRASDEIDAKLPGSVDDDEKASTGHVHKHTKVCMTCTIGV